jgi:hypothetical protein
MSFCERILEAIAQGGYGVFKLLLVLQAALNGCF